MSRLVGPIVSGIHIRVPTVWSQKFVEDPHFITDLKELTFVLEGCTNAERTNYVKDFCTYMESFFHLYTPAEQTLITRQLDTNFKAGTLKALLKEYVSICTSRKPTISHVRGDAHIGKVTLECQILFRPEWTLQTKIEEIRMLYGA